MQIRFEDGKIDSYTLTLENETVKLDCYLLGSITGGTGTECGHTISGPKVEQFLRAAGVDDFSGLEKRAQELDHVIQVRCHHVLKQKFIDQIGRDGINLICIVPSTMKDDAFIRFTTLLPNEMYNNLDRHDSILQNIESRISEYIRTNTPPTR